MSPPSKYVDLRSELMVAVIRSFIDAPKPMSITHTQKILNRDPGIKGRIWVAKYTSPTPPDTSIRDVIIRTVESMRTPTADGSPPAPLKDIKWPDAVPVEAEWTGYRKSATSSSTLPPILELEKYAELMREVTSPATVLYFHGGAYYLMDPASHRPTTKKIAKLTGGRCYSVRYRLAPQNPFPAALIDALQSYLTLLHPPKGAFHEPVKPENIVFAGDSAGGNLSMALTQLLLEFQRTDTRVHWYGEEIAVPLPAGVALSSPWMDMTHSSPSCKTNAPFDYLPMLQGIEKIPRPSCAAWPASPPRKMLYCADALITHPLVTLLTARNWKGCPPVYMSTGWELLADEDKYMAANLHAQGVPIIWEEFEGMPHCFAMILTDNPMSKRCFDAWTGFIATVAVQGPGSIQSAFTTVKAKTLKEESRDPAKVAPYTEEELWERLRALANGTNTPKAAGDVPAKL
ncbi:hypothetical protein N0V93_002598 [Gnomoniopsis smithogilvyi]|uniref:Alpha/beta hydrolase fold-3 domain-containing protein n=1 Tax=Gnomoniopsis smithogilvyi TaxID=1191159 RepID=A0A9W9CZ84_9PEZI|nr:hypothetical protein N0V93_002598 [Gnomoniopsis smithogilvyi]